jgi:hypothetical protein
VYLALRPVSTRFVSELIVINKTSSTTYYDNYATPVPPYSVTLPQTSFYLLTL